MQVVCPREHSARLPRRRPRLPGVGPPLRPFLPARRLCARASGRASRARQTLARSEEHTSELQSRVDLVCRLLLEKKKKLVNDLQKLSLVRMDTYVAALNDHESGTCI